MIRDLAMTGYSLGIKESESDSLSHSLWAETKAIP